MEPRNILPDLIRGFDSAVADAVVWGGEFARPKRSIWSVADTERSFSTPLKKRKIRDKPTKMKRAARVTRKRSSRVRPSRRVVNSKKKTLTKRIKDVVLKESEMKIHQIRADYIGGDDVTVYSYAAARVPDQIAFGLVGEKNSRKGVEIYASGFSTEFHFSNALTTDQIYVRIIIGYKKYAKLTASVETIFKNQLTDEPIDITGVTNYTDKLMVPTSGKVFTKLKDFTIKLDATAENPNGNDHKDFKIWTPLKRKIKFDGLSEGQDAQSCDPHVYYYAWNQTGIVKVGSIFNAAFKTLLFFKDM